MQQENVARVTVLLVTYNHGRYISDALKSVLQQDFDGSVEIVVADDHSSDNTIELIKEFEGIDSRFTFRYLNSDINLGITGNYERAFTSCRTEYVAVIEGDDVWTHKTKLTQQIALLDDHSECAMCGSNYFAWNEKEASYVSRTAVDRLGFMYIDSRYIINDNLPGNFSACVYRRSALVRLPKALFSLKAYDWAINICVGQFGLIAYMHEPLSIYRIHAGGAWTGLTPIMKIEEQIKAAREYSLVTNGVFNQEFDILIRRLRKRRALLKISPTMGLRNNVRRVRRIVYLLTPPLIVHIFRILLPPAVFAILLRF